MLVIYMTGKGANHLVSFMFPSETISSLTYLADFEVSRLAGVLPTNQNLFSRKQNSTSHAIGWHCINEIFKRRSLEGKIPPWNFCKKRFHRVVSLLAKLQLPENEKTLIYKHFVHSQSINENVYQVAAGSMQLKSTEQRLQQIQVYYVYSYNQTTFFV